MIAKRIRNETLFFTFLKLVFTKIELVGWVTKLVARLLVSETSLGSNQDIPKNLKWATTKAKNIFL
jgi:hypothetical protein